MVKHRKMVLLATLLATVSLAGCGGGGAKSSTSLQATTTTMGQQLIDLKASYDKGIISEQEYNKAKKDILNSYNN